MGFNEELFGSDRFSDGSSVTRKANSFQNKDTRSSFKSAHPVRAVTFSLCLLVSTTTALLKKIRGDPLVPKLTTPTMTSPALRCRRFECLAVQNGSGVHLMHSRYEQCRVHLLPLIHNFRAPADRYAQAPPSAGEEIQVHNNEQRFEEFQEMAFQKT